MTLLISNMLSGSKCYYSVFKKVYWFMNKKLIRIKLQNIRSVLPEMVIVWQSAKQHNLVYEQYLYEHSFRTHTEQLPNDSSVRLCAWTSGISTAWSQGKFTGWPRSLDSGQEYAICQDGRIYRKPEAWTSASPRSIHKL